MESILSEILAWAGQVAADAPIFGQAVTVVESAIAAFRTGNQAALDTAHAGMTQLADGLAPPGA